MQPPQPPLTPSPGFQNVRTSAAAVWSLVLGILALICLPFFASVPAIILGHVANSRIRRSGGALGGGGLAIAGLITGYVSLVWALVIIPILFAIAVPNFIKARETAQRVQCIANLRQIDTAVKIWAVDNAKPEEATVSFEDIQKSLPVVPVCPKGGVYELHTAGENPTCTMPGHMLPPENK